MNGCIHGRRKPHAVNNEIEDTNQVEYLPPAYTRDLFQKIRTYHWMSYGRYQVKLQQC